METERIILATIGYEAADLDDFVATLLSVGITRLIDVRELPTSRRRGFAKRGLSQTLAAAGIEYIHLRGLGDPKEGREAARAGDFTRFKRVFSRHMRTDVAQGDLRIALNLVKEGGACLMCYERDHAVCHRTIVAKAISSRVSARIRHLGVRIGLGGHHRQNSQLELVEAGA